MHWKDKALDHAKKDSPKESVGLLVNIKGKEVYYPCNNLSLNPDKCFVLDPEDYAIAANSGDILSLIHI